MTKSDATQAPEEPPALTASMRQATGGIHDLADAAVNAKLALAFADPRTYGLCVGAFYKIYSAMEGAMARQSEPHGALAPLRPFASQLVRKAAFERDLRYRAAWLSGMRS